MSVGCELNDSCMKLKQMGVRALWALTPIFLEQA